MCQALGYQAIKSGFIVLYRSIFDVVRDFLHDEAFAGQEKVLARYLKPDLLIVDDMGMKQLPKRSGECLFEIIMRRYETRSTMMTSNRPLEDWGKLVGDVPRGHRHSRPLPAPCRRHHHHRQELPIAKQGGQGTRPKVGAENHGRLHGSNDLRYTDTTNPGRF